MKNSLTSPLDDVTAPVAEALSVSIIATSHQTRAPVCHSVTHTFCGPFLLRFSLSTLSSHPTSASSLSFFILIDTIVFLADTNQEEKAKWKVERRNNYERSLTSTSETKR